MGQIEAYKKKIVERAAGILKGLSLEYYLAGWHKWAGKDVYMISLPYGTTPAQAEKARKAMKYAFRAADIIAGKAMGTAPGKDGGQVDTICISPKGVKGNGRHIEKSKRKDCAGGSECP